MFGRIAQWFQRKKNPYEVLFEQLQNSNKTHVVTECRSDSTSVRIYVGNTLIAHTKILLADKHTLLTWHLPEEDLRDLLKPVKSPKPVSKPLKEGICAKCGETFEISKGHTCPQDNI